jgi:hypothetical protein
VHLWNSPGLQWFIKNGGDVRTYGTAEPAELPPLEDVEKLIDHPDNEVMWEGDDAILTFRDPDNPAHTMD